MTVVTPNSTTSTPNRSISLRSRAWVRVVLGMLVAFGFVLSTAVVTAMIDTPWFSREIPTTTWAWPLLIVAAVLAGALVVVSGQNADDGMGRRGMWGSAGMFLAVGCPVCNKIVLLTLGSAGAMTWFAPIQPWLGVASIALLACALWRRLGNGRSCPIPESRFERCDDASATVPVALTPSAPSLNESERVDDRNHPTGSVR